MLDIQIVIPSINLWTKYTKNCIESVVRSSEHAKVKYRILLIDNASIDETLQEAGKMVSETFSHHRSSVIMSFAESVNIGIKDAFEVRGAKYCLVINNDTVLREDTIKKLVERFDLEKFSTKSAKVVMVTAINVQGECTTPTDLENIPEKTCEESEHPDFSCFMINRDCWEKVGPMDEMFKPAYFEDNDYHYRIQLAGLRAINYPKAIYYHYGSATSKEIPNVIRDIQFRQNHDYFVNKWGGEPGKETYKTPFNK